jgi:hypothetical protein
LASFCWQIPVWLQKCVFWQSFCSAHVLRHSSFSQVNELQASSPSSQRPLPSHAKRAASLDVLQNFVPHVISAAGNLHARLPLHEPAHLTSSDVTPASGTLTCEPPSS